jgi:hypothetical protein
MNKPKPIEISLINLLLMISALLILLSFVISAEGKRQKADRKAYIKGSFSPCSESKEIQKAYSNEQ